MYFEEHFCQHLNEIIDHKGGSVVCMDCGLVISNVFVDDYHFKEDITPKNDYILEILSRLEMPDYFKNEILKNLKEIDLKQRKKENAIAFVIYKTLNELQCGVSIKDISAVTGFTDSQIYNFQSSNDSIILHPLMQLDKYCKVLGLPKDSYSVIKGTFKISRTGHNPTTILGTAIYRYCKKYKCGLSMEKIANTLNISSVSIQRYIKYTKNNKNEP